MSNAVVTMEGRAPQEAQPSTQYWESLITEHDAAEFLNVSVRSVQAWRVRGDGPRYVKISARCIRYRRRDLQEWFESKIRTSTSEDPEAA